jgi:hypothetical protein
MWELINQQDAELRTFIRVLKRLLKSGKIKVTKKGKLVLIRSVPYVPLVHLGCKRCESTTIVLSGIFKDTLREYRRLIRGRPLPTPEYDQGFMRPVDVVRRAAFMYKRGDLEQKRILIIGDDDLLSLALGLTRMPKRVTVLEIDERIVSFINRVAKEHGLNVQANIYDVRRPLPRKMQRTYNAFVCDPVETIEGIKLFLSRGTSGLKGKQAALYFGLTHREASLEKWYAIQRMLLDMGYTITDILDNFSTYPDKENKLERFYSSWDLFKNIPKELKQFLPDVNWYKSALIRAELMGKPKEIVKGYVELRKEMYLDNESWVVPYRE